MYFIGITVAVTIVPRMADIIGRKKILIACNIIQLPTYFWLIYMTTI
jgi:MFS family permease